MIGKIKSKSNNDFNQAKLLFENMKEIGEEEFQTQFQEIKNKIEGEVDNEHQKFMLNIFDVGSDL
jgi:hypothetical protein